MTKKNYRFIESSGDGFVVPSFSSDGKMALLPCCVGGRRSFDTYLEALRRSVCVL